MGASAAAYGREKGDFVAGAKSRIPGDEFLVARGDNRGAVFCELGMARRVEGEELLDGGGIGCKLGGVPGLADEFLEATEKEDCYANRLGDWRHRGIVTRVAQVGQRHRRNLSYSATLQHLICSG